MPFKLIGVRLDQRVGEASDFVEFRIGEVNYINVIRPKGKSHHIPIYHTSHGSYAPLLTLRDLSTALLPRGFEQMDGSILVNSARVKDKTMTDQGMIIIFDDDTTINVALRSRKRKK
ncbi:LytTR family transcriptional regulator DNA-binding domain-containing protein [Cohnella xylanilytica]|uniref:LytTR family transcriptional regulator DNA-binding domain-containing protein n=1 Tax=Cohnella xylanilytica TaxID=557555 RepID=A0A841TR65_9BACL|nr:LytTR family transcriptional regulator DNA-binding domain-containing protein [Cohnella xylanilytica]MBB6690786.1 LytTR family transcriptional regulator DNA-binding domain-containing protein [Cohnella xylanilytica]